MRESKFNKKIHAYEQRSQAVMRVGAIQTVDFVEVAFRKEYPDGRLMDYQNACVAVFDALDKLLQTFEAGQVLSGELHQRQNVMKEISGVIDEADGSIAEIREYIDQEAYEDEKSDFERDLGMAIEERDKTVEAIQATEDSCIELSNHLDQVEQQADAYIKYIEELVADLQQTIAEDSQLMPVSD